ncbi:MAG: cofactor-independent phosphoglycerate mutase [Methanobacterium sp.]|nr:cofactor-independent phosphoglycerate mutase [Methanobacterium sp.]
MKYVVVIGDGMADYPLEELNGKTPLQTAHIPNMDSIAANGVNGLLKTIPDGMEPGSDVANLSIMGYNPRKYYTGRGPLEAASIGAELEDDDIAFRCNFIFKDKGLLADFNADHISTVEASELIEALNQAFYKYGKFYLGTSYRNLFVCKNKEMASLESTPPHDVVGEPIKNHLIKPEEDTKSLLINRIMDESQDILKDHPINLKRVQEGKKPANMIWLWGQGPKPNMKPFKSEYGIKGATITGVDLIKGLGVYLGLTNIHVPGATGYYDTDYCGKAKYALKSLEDNDLVFIHVEAPDEAAHAGDLDEKIKAIERIDKRILEKLLDNLPNYDDYSISILPDHPTPITIKTHALDPVPYAMCSTKGSGDDVNLYDEESAKSGSQGLLDGHKFIKNLLDYSG